MGAHIPNGSGNGWIKIDTFEALARGIEATLDRTSPHGSPPLILAGDFNEPQAVLGDGTIIPFTMKEVSPGEWEAKGDLRGAGGRAYPRQRWVDGVKSILGEQPVGQLQHVVRVTEGPTSWHTTHRVRGLDRYFDHLLVSAHWRVLRSGLDHAVREHGVSDHSLLWADVELVDRPPPSSRLKRRPQVRVFLAISIDGFIAGPGDSLDWLPAPGEGEAEDTFTPFFKEIGAMLMGRRTFDVVSAFGGPWPYGDTPVLVATHRLIATPPATVQAISGSIAAMVERACQAAGHRDVYLDGGALVRAALDEDLVDEITLTVVPKVLGSGVSLFAGVAPAELRLVSSREIGGGMVQLRYARAGDRPAPSTARTRGD